MTWWIVNFQVFSKDAAASALAMWRKEQSLPWLVASISKLQAGDPAEAEVNASAARLAPNSPAWPTVTYHRIRLLLDAGDRDGARRMLDSNMQAFRQTLAPDSLNLFLAWRMALARNVEDFLQFAARRPAGLQWWDSPDHPPQELFDRDAAQVLNEQLPLSALAEAAASEALPRTLRDEVATATWVRALLLANQPTVDALSPTAAKLHPEIATYVKDYLASSPAERRFAAAWLFLHNPGLKPYLAPGIEWRVSYSQFGKPLKDMSAMDAFRNNWWCGFIATKMQDPVLGRVWQGAGANQPPSASPEPARFLSEDDKARFVREWKRLEELDTGPNYLGRVVVEWVRQHPGDPRAPEALHLAVMATRYGCTNQDTWQVSKAAFNLLHAKYPDSQWAKATKFWFK